MAPNAVPRGGLRPIQSGPQSYILLILMLLVVVLAFNYWNSSTKNAQLLDELSKLHHKHRTCLDDIRRQKNNILQSERGNDNTRNELNDLHEELRDRKQSEKRHIEQIEACGRNISQLIKEKRRLESESLQQSASGANKNCQELIQTNKNNLEEIFLKEKDHLKQKIDDQTIELQKHQETMKALQKTIDTQNIELQKLQENQNKQKNSDQGAVQSQNQGRTLKETHDETQNQNQGQAQNLNQGQAQNQAQAENQNKGQAQNQDQAQNQNQGQAQNQDQAQNQNQGQAQNQNQGQAQGQQVKERQDDTQHQNQGQQQNENQNETQQQESQQKQNSEKTVASQPLGPTNSSLLKIDADHVPGSRPAHWIEGARRPGDPVHVMQHGSTGVRSADAFTGKLTEASGQIQNVSAAKATAVDGHKGILSDVQDAGYKEEVVGKPGSQEVAGSPGQLGAIKHSNAGESGTDREQKFVKKDAEITERNEKEKSSPAESERSSEKVEKQE